MRPVDAYWNRKRMLGEIPRALSPQAEAVLRRELVPNRRHPEHHALAGLRYGGFPRTLVEHLLTEGEADTRELSRHFGVPMGSIRSTLDHLVKGGRIRVVGKVEDTTRQGHTTFNIYAAMDTEALLRDAVEGMAA